MGPLTDADKYLIHYFPPHYHLLKRQPIKAPLPNQRITRQPNDLLLPIPQQSPSTLRTSYFAADTLQHPWCWLSSNGQMNLSPVDQRAQRLVVCRVVRNASFWEQVVDGCECGGSGSRCDYDVKEDR